MKRLLVIPFLLYFLAAAVIADDKSPRDDKDKKESSQKAPESALDKAKDRLKEKGEGDKKHSGDSDDGSDFFVNMVGVLADYYPENLRYTYSPYPYCGSGMFQREPASARPVYIESNISGFTGFNHIRAISANIKLKLFTFSGLEYNFVKLDEKTKYYDSQMRIHRLGGLLNILTHTYGILEGKFGYTRIIDSGGGPMIGIELTLAPIKPLIFRGNLHTASINSNQVGDYYLGTGFAAGAVELYGGYRIFKFPGTAIDGPTGGLIIRF
jgi:hypothetical protein